MRLEHLEIRGFRSLRRVAVPFSRLTTLIGPNGSGKSSVLSALNLFFDQTATVDDLDFWSGLDEGSASDVISITARWCDFSDEEAEALGGVLDTEGRLEVERRFDGPGKGVYLRPRPAVPQFSTIRRLERGHREEYDKLRETPPFNDLPEVGNKMQVFNAMDTWEAEHPDQCVISDEEFDKIGALLERITFLSIAAFEDPATHLNAENSGAVSRLIEHVVDQSLVQQELADIAEEASARSADVLADARGQLDAVGDSMEAMVESFAPGCRLELEWDSEISLRSARPRLKVDIQSADGLVRPLEYQGHGIQRSLMYAALTAAREIESDDDRTVVLVIEEPEAFQHPLSCRVLARTLRELSGRNYQIAYATHSSEFVHADIIDGLRTIRREDRDGDGHASFLNPLSMDDLLAQWERVFEGDGYTAESVLGRLTAHLTPQVLEGLFARTCVLVEGDEDEALVRGAAAQRDLDLDAAGVAVIQTNGKSGMPNVLAFLTLAGIACYPVFDLDRSKSLGDQHREAEDQILRGLGVSDPVAGGVHKAYACWEENFTKTFREDLNEDYEGLLEASASKYGYTRPSRARKVPVVVADVLARADEAGIETPTLGRLSDALEEIVTESH